jgi:hypothetical protein
MPSVANHAFAIHCETIVILPDLGAVLSNQNLGQLPSLTSYSGAGFLPEHRESTHNFFDKA